MFGFRCSGLQEIKTSGQRFQGVVGGMGASFEQTSGDAPWAAAPSSTFTTTAISISRSAAFSSAAVCIWIFWVSFDESSVLTTELLDSDGGHFHWSTLTLLVHQDLDRSIFGRFLHLNHIPLHPLTPKPQNRGQACFSLSLVDRGITGSFHRGEKLMVRAERLRLET